MKTRLILIVSIILIAFLFGYQTATTKAPANLPPNGNNTPINTDSTTGYPVSTPVMQLEEAYPSIGSAPSGRAEGPKFEISKPVSGGDTIIEGTGPANVPIKLVDVTEVGVLLGETTINDEGFFRFELDNPVQSGHTIGIQLGDISKTDLNPLDFQYSSTYYDRPQIGVLFDMANVE